MKNNNLKPEPKKKFSGSFFLFLLASVLLFLTINNFTGSKNAKVSFSHQAEHLVNLDLLQKEESRKISINDHLVTFTGRFKDRVSDDAKSRARYLQFLDRHYEIEQGIETLNQQLPQLRQNVMESAETFMLLSGLAVPPDGFRVVDPIYDTTQAENSVIIRQLPSKKFVNLRELNQTFTSIEASASPVAIAKFRSDLITLIKGFRSSNLGIGSETIKEDLIAMEKNVGAAVNPEDLKASVATYRESLSGLVAIVNELAVDHQGFSLTQLRSVRSYKTDLEQQNYLIDEQEKNQSQLDKARQSVENVIWFFNNKEVSSRTLEAQDPEVFSHWYAQAKMEWDQFPANKGMLFKAPDQPRNLVLDKTFKSQEPSPNYFTIILTILPIALIGLLLYFVFSKQMKGMGNGAMSFGKSPARLLSKDQNPISFKDVAGCDEAKEELQEIVEFLKDPAKFTALGASIPKGVLLVGSPGTGKTLIAKAVAGEADRPFFSISGSDFVEMFVGVGASRIRDMFDQAKKHAPCLIFMDEIDAVGRHRGAGVGGGHDEREQTLNQLLVEMDGFATSEGVILIAATNRPDVLDKALMRPGRFDRRIIIDLPDIKGRHEILKVHARKIKLDPSVDLRDVARQTPGASGADLRNVLNESALLAARKGRSAVTGCDVLEACDKVRYGKERRSMEIDDNEKRTTAYHEAGHAIVALIVDHSDPVEKVTIIPRGMSLGATHFAPKKNRLNYWKKELLDQLAVLMGGRVAEEVFLSDISSGAQMDFTQATRLARSMVCEWGMTDSLGQVSYGERNENGQYLGMSISEKSYSEETAKNIDDEVRCLCDKAYARAKEIITEHSEQIELMTEMLIEFETLDHKDVHAIIDGTWDSEKKRQSVEDALSQNKISPPPVPKKPTENPFRPSTDGPEPQGI